MKIAVPKEFFKEGLDKEIEEGVKKGIEKLKSLGAEVEEISFPITDEGLSAYYIISSAEASSNLARYDGIRYGYRTEEFEDVYDLMEKSRTEGFGQEVKRRIMLEKCFIFRYYDAILKSIKFKKKIKNSLK
jgi:aspartyl-tRNA(Asn)/glutamyl-tRNA(Gln) amidotransferase subunit A